jgi:hypothetical protein
VFSLPIGWFFLPVIGDNGRLMVVELGEGEHLEAREILKLLFLTEEVAEDIGRWGEELDPAIWSNADNVVARMARREVALLLKKAKSDLYMWGAALTEFGEALQTVSAESWPEEERQGQKEDG